MSLSIRGPLQPLCALAGAWGRLAWAALRAWIAHRAPSKGAALAFYTLFSMAPVLVLVMGVVGYFLGDQAVQGELFSQLKGVMGSPGALAVQSLVADAHRSGATGTATVLASGLLFIGATSVFSELKDSLDDIWNIQIPVPTGFLAVLRSRMLAFGLVLILAFLLLITVVVNAGLAVVAKVWLDFWSLGYPLVAMVSHLFSFLILASLFAVIFKMLPEVTLSWSDVVMGALVTAALFDLGKFLIGLYLSSSAVTSSFGAAGSAAALLSWVYYSAQIFFLGAEFTREYALSFGSLRRVPASN